MNKKLVHLANSVEDSEPLIGFINEIKIEDDGWAVLAPPGEFANTAVVVQPDGSLRKFRAIQLLDRESMNQMVNSFKGSKLKRYLTGAPIFDGHPDMPGMGVRYPDKTPKGIISGLEVRDDRLCCKPIFTNEGQAILDSRKPLYFSARWTAKDAGKRADGTPILRPNVLVSAGLTEIPNLPVPHLMNAEWQEEDQTTNTEMKKQIIETLIAMGVQLANDATEEQIVAGLKSAQEKQKLTVTLANEKETAVTELTNEKAAHLATKGTLDTKTTELANAKTELANERKAHVTAVLDLAIKDGRITPAQREEWSGKLAANFANESEAIKKLAVTIKTVPVTGESGDRKIDLSNAVQLREKVSGLVSAEMSNSKCDYDTAWIRVQKAHPSLFQNMKHPEIKTRF